MMDINDEILNKYIDGELDKITRLKVEETINDSPELIKKLNLLKSIHKSLKQIKEYELTEDFTAAFMTKIKKGVKRKREQNYFIISISMIFILLCVGILGYVSYEIIKSAQPTDFDLSFDTVKNIAESIPRGIADLLLNNFTLIGSIISFGVLVSAYFFFEAQRKGIKV